MLTPLVCTQCGGKLDVEKSQVFESGDFVIVSSDQTFKCPHCGMKYLPGEKINHASEKSAISISIGGKMTNSAIVIGNGLVVNKSPDSEKVEDNQKIKQNHSANLQPEIKAAEQKPRKNWWQFWKN
jgi:hypothetical protein